jgi:putative spermidine/putrescine transport system permease protein
MFLTDATTYTLPVALISNMRASFDLTLAAASILLIGFTIILILILDRFAGVDRVVGIGLQRS